MTESAEEFIKRKQKEFEKNREQGKIVKMKDVGRKGKHCWLREKWTFMKQHDYDEKVFIFERLMRAKYEGKICHHKKRPKTKEYRIGYYIVGKIGRGKGKWLWGQFCPMIPEKDLTKLLSKAKKEGVIKGS